LTENRMTDPAFLRGDQYKDSDNLYARIALHELFSSNPENWFRWLFDRFQLPETARVLEVGCGPGDLWASNQDRIPENWELTLTDLSEGMLFKTRKRLGAIPMRLCCTSVDRLSFPEDCFNVVIGNHMIYHAPDLERALSEIRRVLSPGGKVITATNGKDHLKELYEIITGFDPSYQVQAGQINYTLESGEELLANAFHHVHRYDFPNNLQITEAELLLEYTFSLWSINQEYFQQNREQYRAYLQSMLDEKGSIFIQKSVGVLIATNPK
jgi:ubiquinone/menaquinone biosynthesis C-methylase UbiE